MQFIHTNFKNLMIIKPHLFNDERGYFFESYNKALFEKEGLDYTFIQDNQSKSMYGTIRGLHCQLGKYSQAKLVRVIQGKILDIVVDIRLDSDTFGKWFSIELSDENQKQLLIPRGFLHGYSVLSKECIFAYKVDNVYNKEAEYGVLYNDRELNIDWQISKENVIISEKDKNNHLFKELKAIL